MLGYNPNPQSLVCGGFFSVGGGGFHVQQPCQLPLNIKTPVQSAPRLETSDYLLLHREQAKDISERYFSSEQN